MDNSTATTAAANATVDIVKQLAEAADGLTTEQLTLLVAVVPHADLLEATPTTLHAIYDLVTAQTNIATVWAPDLWAITALFIICLVLKIFGALMTTKKQVERVQETGVRSEQSLVTFANAETLLEKPARSALGHLMNLTVSTIALAMQCLGARLFAVPGTDFAFEDIKLMSLAIKLILVSYAADLLYGTVHLSIYLHHICTFALLLAGQLSAYHTASPKFFRMATWLLLQATTEQATYLAMWLYHTASWLNIQDYAHTTQRRLLWICWVLLSFTKLITYPQKIIPAAFALYWLARMWNEVDDLAWGKFWIGLSTSMITLLLLLQVKFCDDVFPLCNYVGFKLRGGTVPLRNGPVARFVFGLCVSKRKPPTQGHQSDSRVVVEQSPHFFRGPHPPVFPGHGRRLDGSPTSPTEHEMATVPFAAYEDMPRQSTSSSFATMPDYEPLKLDSLADFETRSSASIDRAEPVYEQSGFEQMLGLPPLKIGQLPDEGLRREEAVWKEEEVKWLHKREDTLLQ